MANLVPSEKIAVELLLGMKSGYVLDFSDASFQDFVQSVTGLDINSEKYHYASNSKANRLRAFIRLESDQIFGHLLSAFCEHWLAHVNAGIFDYHGLEKSYETCVELSKKLTQSPLIENLNSLQPNNEDKDFALLAKTIKVNIDNNEPEAALDRLHTFTTKYIRQLCTEHKIDFIKNDSLNALFGKYVKHLISGHHIESQMTEKILRFSINVIESFNSVRNNESFAHDNPILNYHESVLIFNNISGIIRFIETIEKKIAEEVIDSQNDELPF